MSGSTVSLYDYYNTKDGSVMTQKQFYIMQYTLALGTNSLSFVAAFAVVISSYQRIRGPITITTTSSGSVYQRLIFMISVCDASLAFCNIIHWYLLPRYTRQYHIFTASGNTATCTFGGYTFYLFPMLISFFNFYLSFYFYCKIKYNMLDSTIKEKYLWPGIIVAILTALGVSTFGLFYNGYKPRPFWNICINGQCVIGIDDPITTDCATKGMALIFEILFTGIIMILAILSVLSTCGLYHAVRQTLQKNVKYHHVINHPNDRPPQRSNSQPNRVASNHINSSSPCCTSSLSANRSSQNPIDINNEIDNGNNHNELAEDSCVPPRDNIKCINEQKQNGCCHQGSGCLDNDPILVLGENVRTTTANHDPTTSTTTADDAEDDAKATSTTTKRSLQSTVADTTNTTTAVICDDEDDDDDDSIHTIADNNQIITASTTAHVPSYREDVRTTKPTHDPSTATTTAYDAEDATKATSTTTKTSLLSTVVTTTNTTTAAIHNDYDDDDDSINVIADNNQILTASTTAHVPSYPTQSISGSSLRQHYTSLRQQHTEEKNMSRLIEVRNQGIMFSLVYLNSFCWLFVKFVINKVKVETIITMGVLVITILCYTFYPIQGFFNFVVYTTPRYKEFRKKYPNGSKMMALYLSLTLEPASDCMKYFNDHNNHYTIHGGGGSSSRSAIVASSHQWRRRLSFFRSYKPCHDNDRISMNHLERREETTQSSTNDRNDKAAEDNATTRSPWNHIVPNDECECSVTESVTRNTIKDCDDEDVISNCEQEPYQQHHGDNDNHRHHNRPISSLHVRDTIISNDE